MYGQHCHNIFTNRVITLCFCYIPYTAQQNGNLSSYLENKSIQIISRNNQSINKLEFQTRQYHATSFYKCDLSFDGCLCVQRLIKALTLYDEYVFSQIDPVKNKKRISKKLFMRE